MKRVSFLVIALFAIGAALGGVATPAQAAGGATYTGSTSPDVPYHDYAITLKAGDTIRIDAGCPAGSSLDPYVIVSSRGGAVLAWDDDGGPLCRDDAFAASLEFTAPADGEYVITVTDYVYGEFEGRTCRTGRCFGDYILTLSGSFTAPASGAAARPMKPVVGTFLTDTVAHWAPGKPTVPPVVFAAGKSAWVLGTDASGEYYKLAYLGDALWVPVEAIGPTHDAVWNGAPLPATAVK